MVEDSPGAAGGNDEEQADFQGFTHLKSQDGDIAVYVASEGEDGGEDNDGASDMEDNQAAGSGEESHPEEADDGENDGATQSKGEMAGEKQKDDNFDGTIKWVVINGENVAIKAEPTDSDED